MKKTEIDNVTIDAVIIWVDGNDKKHQDKMLPYIEDKKIIKSKNFRTRFDQVNEIQFTVDSILKYASFIRQIFIVTDEQTPSFLMAKKEKYKNVSIVDHKVIFKDLETNLPTFNSRTIESCIYRIPGLSEHFIHLNDDFFIINHLTKNDFFSNKGYPILRGKWQKFETDKFYKKKKKGKASHKRAQEKGAKLLGFKKFYRFKHTPHPIRKSTLEIFFEKNPNILTENIKYRFRNRAQFLPVALANHLEIKNKTCHLKNDYQLVYFRSYKKHMLWYKYKLKIKTDKNLFLGMQNLDKAPIKILSYLLDWLKNRTN